MQNITVENGIYSIGGETFTETELADKFGVASGILIKSAKSNAQIIEKTAKTELSRAKRQHKQAEYARIIEGNSELLAEVAPFNGTMEEYREQAEKTVNAGGGQRS